MRRLALAVLAALILSSVRSQENELFQCPNGKSFSLFRRSRKKTCCYNRRAAAAPGAKCETVVVSLGTNNGSSSSCDDFETTTSRPSCLIFASSSSCPGWRLQGLFCYKFFDVEHSWERAADLCKRWVQNFLFFLLLQGRPVVSVKGVHLVLYPKTRAMPSCPFTLYGSAPFVFERSVKGKCFIRETDHWRQHSGRLFRPSADALKPNVGDFHLILAKKKKRKTFTCVNYCVSLNSEDNFFGSYGSDLVVVESYQQNNISERLAQEGLNAVTHPDAAFWLGLMSLDDLSTNTLEAASGSLVPQYAGTCCGFPMKKGKHLAKLTSVFKRFLASGPTGCEERTVRPSAHGKLGPIVGPQLLRVPPPFRLPGKGLS